MSLEHTIGRKGSGRPEHHCKNKLICHRRDGENGFIQEKAFMVICQVTHSQHAHSKDIRNDCCAGIANLIQLRSLKTKAEQLSCVVSSAGRVHTSESVVDLIRVRKT